MLRTRLAVAFSVVLTLAIVGTSSAEGIREITGTYSRIASDSDEEFDPVDPLQPPFAFWKQLDHDVTSRITDTDLHDVHFPTDRVGYVVGTNGTVLRTPAVDDAEERVLETWTAWILRHPAEESDPGLPLPNLNGVHFATERIGYAVGDDGTVIHTRDGGVSWFLRDTGSEVHLRDVHVPVASLPLGAAPGDIAYAVGDGGTVIKTSDQGETWSRLPTVVNPDSGTPVALRAVAFPTPERGYVISQFGAWHSESSESIGMRFTPMHFDVAVNPLWDVEFPNPAKPLEGYAVGGGPSGIGTSGTAPLVLKTLNGTDWINVSPPLPRSTQNLAFRSVAFGADGRRGQVVGDRGLVLTTEDSGEDWTLELVDARSRGATLFATAFGWVPAEDGDDGLSSSESRVSVGPAGVILERETDPEDAPPALCLPLYVTEDLVDRVSDASDEAEPPEEVRELREEVLSLAGDAMSEIVEAVPDDVGLSRCEQRGAPDDVTVESGDPEERLASPPRSGPCDIKRVNPEFPCLWAFDFRDERGEAVDTTNLVLMSHIEKRRLVAYHASPPRVFLYDIDRLEQRGLPGLGRPFSPDSSSARGDETGVINLRESSDFQDVDGFNRGDSTRAGKAIDIERDRLFVAEVGPTAVPRGRAPRIAAISLTGEFEPTLIELDAAATGIPPRLLLESNVSFLSIDSTNNLLYMVVDGPAVPGEFLTGIATGWTAQNASVTLLALRPEVEEGDAESRRVVLKHHWALPLEERCRRTVTFGMHFRFMGVSRDGRSISFPCAETSFTYFGLGTTVPASILTLSLPAGREPAAIRSEHFDEFRFRVEPMAGVTQAVNVVRVEGAPASELLQWRVGSRHFFWHYGRHEWLGGATIGRAGIVADDAQRGRLYLSGGDVVSGDGGEPGMLALAQSVDPPLDIAHARVATGLGDIGNSGDSLGVFDATTRRLFAVGETLSGPHVVVLEDRIPPDLPQALTDPDAFTNDIGEDDAASLNRTGESSAFGARVWWTGMSGVLPGTHTFRPDGWVENPTQTGNNPPAYAWDTSKQHGILGPHLSTLPWEPHSSQRELLSAEVPGARLIGEFTGQLSEAAAQALSIDGRSRQDVTTRIGAAQVGDSLQAQGRAPCQYQVGGLPPKAFREQCQSEWQSEWDAGWDEMRGEPPRDENGEEIQESKQERQAREERQEDWERLNQCTQETHDRLLRELDGEWATFWYPDKEDKKSRRPCFEDFDRHLDPDWNDETQENDRPGLEETIGWTRGSRCADPGEDDRSFDGSAVVCDLANWRTEASAVGGFDLDLPGGGALRVGSSISATRSFLDAKRGMVSQAFGVAGDVEVSIPGRGTLRIGEVRARAVSWANGRPEGADSEFDVAYRDVEITRADGSLAFSCGPEGVFAGDDQAELPSMPDDAPVDGPGQPTCDPDALAPAVSRVFGSTLEAVAPDRDFEKSTRGSDGGAQAIVRRNRSDFSADVVLFNVTRYEVPGLQLRINADGSRFNRFRVDLAGVFAASIYQIGQARQDVETPPGALAIELTDHEGAPLADGVFEVTALDGTGLGECRTGPDGVGGCRFSTLDPGTYAVRQVAAPTGYMREESRATVSVSPGSTSTARFVNVRNAGGVEVTLVDTGGEPIQGGVFELAHDESGTSSVCTTGPDGRCVYALVPLGTYRLVQTATAEGYEPEDEPIEFSISRPGQVATIEVVNGRSGSGAGGSTVRIIEIIEGAEPIVSSDGASRGLYGLVRDAVAGALGFLLRNPLQALLFLLLFGVLFAPVYGLARRADLIAAEETT